MKALTKIASLMALLPMMAFSAPSSYGTNSGGGGIIEYAKPQDVRSALLEIYKDQDSMMEKSPIFDALIALNTRRSQIQDSTVKAVLDRVLDQGIIRKIFEVTKYELQDRSCIDRDGQARAASVAAVNLGKDWPRSFSDYDKSWNGSQLQREEFFKTHFVKICYSTNELSKVPRANLQQQLLALTIHELTHVFGYDEQTAVRVQNYILETGRELANPKMDSFDQLRTQVDILGQLFPLEGAPGSFKNEMNFCLRSGKFLGAFEQTSVLVFGMSEESRDERAEKTYRNIIKFVRNIDLARESLEAYCTGVPEFPHVPEEDPNVSRKNPYYGNRKAVNESLKYISQQLEKLSSLLEAF